MLNAKLDLVPHTVHRWSKWNHAIIFKISTKRGETIHIPKPTTPVEGHLLTSLTGIVKTKLGQVVLNLLLDSNRYKNLNSSLFLKILLRVSLNKMKSLGTKVEL